MINTLMAFFLCSSIWALSSDSRRLLSFKDIDSIELKGEADYVKVKEALSPFGINPVKNKNGLSDVSIGVYEYPFFFHRFREFWMAALTETPNGPQYTYLSVTSDNPLPRWLNNGLGYNLPFLKTEIKLDKTSAKVAEVAFSLGTLPLDRSQSSLHIQHYEHKRVSLFGLNGEVLTRSYNEDVDYLKLSPSLKRLKFSPQLWILRNGATGSVDIPK